MLPRQATMVLTERMSGPGDYLPHDADEIEGFKERLNERLAPANPKESDTEWEVGDCLAQWSAPIPLGVLRAMGIY
jgi:hypothetical protein